MKTAARVIAVMVLASGAAVMAVPVAFVARLELERWRRDLRAAHLRAAAKSGNRPLLGGR